MIKEMFRDIDNIIEGAIDTIGDAIADFKKNMDSSENKVSPKYKTSSDHSIMIDLSHIQIQESIRAIDPKLISFGKPSVFMSNKMTLEELLVRQAEIKAANAENRRLRHVEAGKRARDKTILINERTRGLKYVLTPLQKTRKTNKKMKDRGQDQYVLF